MLTKIYLLIFFNVILLYCSDVRTCESHEYECPDDGVCIANGWICDGEEDCFDGSDERQNCSEIVTKAPKVNKIKEGCKDSEFRCRNNQCVPSFTRCNKIYDCADESDEIDCKDGASLNNNLTSSTVETPAKIDPASKIMKVDEALNPKQKNIFNRTTIHELNAAEIPDIHTDFLQSTATFLETLNNESQVAPEQLNKFSDGLNQYYLSKAYEYHFTKVQPLIANESFTDPVCMPNATVNNIEFFKVKIYGFPGFKGPPRVSTDIDSGPYAENYEIHFNTTSEVFIINGYFKVDDKQFYFVYHSDNNVYSSSINSIRTKYGLLKPKRTTDDFSVENDVFVHTFEAEEKHAIEVGMIHPLFLEVLRSTYMPKLASFAEGLVKPLQREADIQFSQVYRQKVLDTLIESAHQYLRTTGHQSHEFSAQSVRNTRPGNTTFYTYTPKLEGYLNYEKYDLNSSQTVGDELTSFMNDTIKLHFPQDGEKTCSFIVTVDTDLDNTSYVQKFGIKSIEIMIAYKADFSSFPVRVYRNLEKWKFTKTGFYLNIDLYNFDSFYHFALQNVQVESAKLIGSILDVNK